MKAQRDRDAALRLFIALDLPEEVRAGVAAWSAAELTDPALRRVDPAALHLTLVFLGSRPERDVARIAEVLGGIRVAAPALELGDLVPVPRRRPRVLALDARAPEAVGLQGRLAEDLERAGLHTAEERPFWPHLTVARVRQGAGAAGSGRGACEGAAPLPEELRRPFRSVRMTLYLSKTKPSGAEYSPLAQAELPRGRH